MKTDLIVQAPKWKVNDVAYISTPDTFKGGKWYYIARGPFKIMGIIGNYAMCRFPRAFPFTVAISDLRKTSEECIYVK